MTDPYTSAALNALTEDEQNVLGWIYIHEDTGHDLYVVQSLLEKGWIVKEGTGYTYPCFAAHIIWCEWCSEQED
jgi:hypothetical protein